MDYTYIIRRQYPPVQMEPVLPYDDNNNHLLVNYLIGAEMVYASIMHQCLAYCVVNNHRPTQAIFRRHSVIVMQLLERLANMASISPASPSAVAHLVSGSSWLDPFKPQAEDETALDKLSGANSAIVQFIEALPKQLMDVSIQVLCLEVETEHKKISLDLAALLGS